MQRAGITRGLLVLAAAVLAALGAVALAANLGNGSSHREAPLSSLDPTADDTDIYAFTARDAPGLIVAGYSGRDGSVMGGRRGGAEDGGPAHGHSFVEVWEMPVCARAAPARF